MSACQTGRRSDALGSLSVAGRKGHTHAHTQQCHLHHVTFRAAISPSQLPSSLTTRLFSQGGEINSVSGGRKTEDLMVSSLFLCSLKEQLTKTMCSRCVCVAGLSEASITRSQKYSVQLVIVPGFPETVLP